MAIISEKKNNLRTHRWYNNTQIRYALIYVCITFVVLLFLNVYTSGTSQKIFYQNKQSSMIDRCLMASAEIGNLEVLNSSTVASAVSEMSNPKVTRLIVTDQYGIAIYDSATTDSFLGSSALLPEIVSALEGNDVFSWQYHAGAMQSCAATPILSFDTIVGCVYMTEYDTEQGALIQSLQSNILTITIILELVVILFSFTFANAFSTRMRKIVSSMKIIREGNYSHKVSMGGRDELTVLGEEFNELTDKLQSSEEKRRQFVSDASHELKTPLASIKLLTDSILQNDVDMQTTQEFVSDIGQEADRLTRMTQKLLSLSRIESQGDGDCEIVGMVPTIQRAIRMLSGIAEKNDITIDLQVAEDCPILILEDDLYQIVFNLTENGIKYNVPGGRLTISVFRQEDNAVLQLRDTGVGIPEEALGQIFERFYRVDKARSRQSGGSGLGLSIVRTIVERNQGQITAASTPGEGSVFTVTFPIFDTDENN